MKAILAALFVTFSAKPALALTLDCAHVGIINVNSVGLALHYSTEVGQANFFDSASKTASDGSSVTYETEHWDAALTFPIGLIKGTTSSAPVDVLTVESEVTVTCTHIPDEGLCADGIRLIVETMADRDFAGKDSIATLPPIDESNSKNESYTVQVQTRSDSKELGTYHITTSGSCQITAR